MIKKFKPASFVYQNLPTGQSMTILVKENGALYTPMKSIDGIEIEGEVHAVFADKSYHCYVDDWEEFASYRADESYKPIIDFFKDMYDHYQIAIKAHPADVF